MGGGAGRTEAILREITSLRAQRDELDSRIRFFEAQLRVAVGATAPAAAATRTLPPRLLATKPDATALHAGAGGGGGGGVTSPRDMIGRYRRHLFIPEFGIQGQRRLSGSSVLVVGAGGLGSTVAMYLAACGVGCLGIVDGSNVGLGDLHRQVMHTEAYVGRPKVKSAAAACRAINASVKVFEYHLKLNPKVALDVVRQYDIVVDATNNLPSRYMLSDCCVLLNKPIISGSAFSLEGQVTVYNHNGSPCYRCLFPNPPTSEACHSCSDNGVLGIVPGVIGCILALEVIKVATGVGEPLCGRMLHFDALSSRFKTIRRRSSTCTVCGEYPAFTQHVFMMFDYDGLTKSSMVSKLYPTLNYLPENARVTCREYKQLLDRRKLHLLLDVRPAHHFHIASLPNSLNIPVSDLEKKLPLLQEALNKAAEPSHSKQFPLYVICRCGYDSQDAVRILRENGFLYASDIIGGLESWVSEVDPNFLVYW